MEGRAEPALSLSNASRPKNNGTTQRSSLQLNVQATRNGTNRLVIVDREYLRFREGLLGVFSRQKNRAERTECENAKQDRGLDRSCHWGCKPYQSRQ